MRCIVEIDLEGKISLLARAGGGRLQEARSDLEMIFDSLRTSSKGSKRDPRIEIAIFHSPQKEDLASKASCLQKGAFAPDREGR